MARPGRDGQVPVPGIMVTLHRVGSDSSGALDSVRTDAAGRYHIDYSRTSGDGAVYFAAAIYSGIAYFTIPLQSGRAQGEEAEITVFDTTSRSIQMTVRGHHIVVSAPRPDGVRDVVEVWELSNDTTVTLVGRDSLTPVWTAPLPRGATNVVGGQGDVSADAISARGGRVVLLAPFGPGVKQVSYSYALKPGDFPLTIPLEGPTSVLEVLLEEPAAQVTGASLRATEAAVTSGRTFKRFLGQDAPAGESVRITVPVTTAATRTRVLAAVAGVIALVMVGALVLALRRRGARVLPAPSRRSERESLLAAIAALDARREQGDATLTAEDYEVQRAALKARLADMLAAGGAPT